jgi:hypothetical protein
MLWGNSTILGDKNHIAHLLDAILHGITNALDVQQRIDVPRMGEDGLIS